MSEQRSRPSKDWYRHRIAQMDDLEFRAGPAAQFGSTLDPNQPPLTLAFGVLVRLERRNKKLSVAELARKLQVEEEEVRQIEHDQSYRARPRTIVNIANYFDLPVKKLMKLAGATVTKDPRFTAEAQRFAAHSDDLGALTSEERRALDQFVEFLKHKA